MRKPYTKGKHHRDWFLRRQAKAQEWAKEYRSGRTLEEIGADNGVSRERVRQVITEFYGSIANVGGASAKAKKRCDELNAARDKESFKKHGCSYAQYRELVALKATKPFIQQVNNARNRGIEWKLTLWEWWQIWQRSGKWGERGRSTGYCMCRYLDRGAYEPNNVYISTCSDNVRYYAKVVKPLRKAEAA